MSRVDSLRAQTRALTPQALLRLLLEDRFPSACVVTASLRAPSVVVLKMVADIDPATPIVFCQRGSPFPESEQYRERIVGLLGLSNVVVSEGHEPQPRRGDYDHCEKMWVEYEHGPGRSREIVHLNDTLAPYACWISAVYHDRRPDDARARVDAEGRLLRVDPLVGWNAEDVRAFVREHGLPLHARAYRGRLRMPPRGDDTPVETFNV